MTTSAVALFTAFLLFVGWLSGQANPNTKTLANSFAKDTTLDVIVCKCFSDNDSDSGEKVYSIVFYAVNGEDLLNDGDLIVSKVAFAKARPDQKGKLTVDKAGKFKHYQPDHVFVGVS